METQKSWPNKERFKWRQAAVLTLQEGSKMEAILAQYSCANISQLCKRIVRGEIELKLKNKPD